MTPQAEGAATAAADHRYAISGQTKFVLDIAAIFEIKFLTFLRGWYWYLIGTLVFPVGMFYFARALVPDTTEAVQRAMTGTIVFGATMVTTNMLAQQVIQDRFQGRLKLVITMPVSKVSYACGVLAFGFMLTALTIAMLLAVACAAGVDFNITWAFLPLVVAVVLTMSGLALFFASFAPTAELGGIISNLFGILLAFISPVYFSMEQAPFVMRTLGWVSPLRYAADGMMKSFSGRTDVWVELTVLAGFAVATMGLGLWKLRWRET